MKTLPVNAGKEEIKNLVVEWNELLAQEKYSEAMDLILYDDTMEIDEQSWIWTSEKLEAAVFTYGEPWYTKEEIEEKYGPGSAEYKVTSILENPNREKIMEDIEVSSDFGWMGENDIAVIHYNVPLNGEISDLTAIFFVRKVDDTKITLVFRELHVL